MYDSGLHWCSWLNHHKNDFWTFENHRNLPWSNFPSLCNMSCEDMRLEFSCWRNWGQANTELVVASDQKIFILCLHDEIVCAINESICTASWGCLCWCQKFETCLRHTSTGQFRISRRSPYVRCICCMMFAWLFLKIKEVLVLLESQMKSSKWLHILHRAPSFFIYQVRYIFLLKLMGADYFQSNPCNRGSFHLSMY